MRETDECSVRFDFDDALYVKVRVHDDTLERINNALASGSLPFRTRTAFILAAISYALDSLDADDEMTMMGLHESDSKPSR